MRDAWTLVVGGSGGIGSACAEALAADGHAVLVTYATGAARAEAVVARIRAAGGRAEARRVSLPDADLSDLPPLRSVVFAAGADIGQPYLSALEPDDLRHAVDV
jgi:3-oxoacyl-[acyl-carrier protein] reductase